LTFALHWFLSEKVGIPVKTFGIDLQTHLIQKHVGLSEDLAWDMKFEAVPIIGWATEKQDEEIDIVVALHACDTATDQALFQAIKRNASLILAAPCCHHNLNRQLSQQVRAKASSLMGDENLEVHFSLVNYDNVFKQQLADMLTDWFRAHILRAYGYKVEIVEFVKSSHTGKNLLLRAVRQNEIEVQGFFRLEYEAMKSTLVLFNPKVCSTTSCSLKHLKCICV